MTPRVYPQSYNRQSDSKSSARLAALFVLPARRSTAGQTPTAAQPPQTQQPTFKLSVDYVEVDVVVTDRQGNLVRDLKKEDFQVLEDGKPQAISAFTLVDIPDRACRSPAVRRGADRARREDQRAAVRRPRLRDGHRRSAHALRPHAAGEDRGEAVHRAAAGRQRSDGDRAHRRAPPTRNQEFTSNKRLLLAAVDKTQRPQARFRHREQDQRVLPDAGHAVRRAIR